MTVNRFAFPLAHPWAVRQALLMAYQQYLLEQLFNFIGVKADKFGQGGEVRHSIAGQRLKDDVGLAAPLDLAAGGDAFGVSEQDDLQENSGLELFVVVDDHHRILIVVAVLETRHSDGSLSVCSMLPKSV